jgi:alcohol dehydrogenase, propanol-preferring
MLQGSIGRCPRCGAVHGVVAAAHYNSRSVKTMALMTAGAGAVEPCDRDVPIALPGEVLVRVRACGVCRTDLHLVDGELPAAEIPVIPGHEIVGVVDVLGDGVTQLAVGDRVGIPWLAYVCGACEFCATGRENLCRSARFTGYHMDGGYAEFVVADAAYVFKLPDGYGDAEAAPLLCAGLVGYRAYRMTGDARRLGLYGFGAAAHLIAQIAVQQGREVFAFTSPGDEATQEFARSLGCAWAGASDQAPASAALDAAIIFATSGPIVPEALSRLEPGGTVVCAGFQMSDIPSFPYRDLREERVVRSVANLTRDDARVFLELAGTLPVKSAVHTYDLADANKALQDVRKGRLQGAAVLTMNARPNP